VDGSKGDVLLPAGDYRIGNWSSVRKDKDGNTWKLEGSSFPDDGKITVAKDQAKELKIGEPIICTLKVSERSANYSIGHSMKGRMGEKISVTKNGARPGPPILRVKNKAGDYNKTFAFKYG
jgi:hypothetical protein